MRHVNLIAQDVAAGQGLAVLSPHGDLAETVLLHVPRNRSNVIMPRYAPVRFGGLNRALKLLSEDRRQMNAIKDAIKLGRTVVGTPL